MDAECWTPHHCEDCGICTLYHDHHCGVFGVCVTGQGFKGNICCFYTLVVMFFITYSTMKSIKTVQPFVPEMMWVGNGGMVR